jgi:membrane protein DedA with SNARE-associated domain
VSDWATGVFDRIGAWGLFALILLENVFPPIPSEVILPLAGFTVSRGEMGFLTALGAATAGSLAGALVLDGVGALVGERRLRSLVARYGRYLLLRESDVDRSADWFDRHGPKAVLIGRCVPGIRSLISIPAGLTRMRLPLFVLLTVAGSLVWNGALVGLGWALGASWRDASDGVTVFTWIVLAALVVAAAVFLLRRLRARRSTS